MNLECKSIIINIQGILRKDNKIVYLLVATYRFTDDTEKVIRANYMVEFTFLEINEYISELQYRVLLTHPNYLEFDRNLNKSPEVNTKFFKNAEVARHKEVIDNIDIIVFSRDEITKRILTKQIDFSKFVQHVEEEYEKVKAYYKEKGYM
jgi:hypothetical protein